MKILIFGAEVLHHFTNSNNNQVAEAKNTVKYPEFIFFISNVYTAFT